MGKNILTQEALDRKRRLVQRLLPELSDDQAASSLSLSKYAESTPEKFFNFEAMHLALDFLRQELTEAKEVHASLLRDHASELGAAFRSLDEVNRLAIHDIEYPDFGDLPHLRLVDETLHPAYLTLCDDVLNAFLLPFAVGERRKRGKSTRDIFLYQRVEEAERTGLAPFLSSFDRVVRNAVARGRIHYCEDGIRYTDRLETRTLSPETVFHLFDDAVDLCNGLALALRCFWVTESEALAGEGARVPLPVLLEELRQEIESPSWSIAAVFRSLSSGGEEQLSIWVRTQFYDEIKVRYSALLTGAAAERLWPGLATYILSFIHSGRPAGAATFQGGRLAEFRNRHMDLVELMDLDSTIDNRAIDFAPPFRVPGLRMPELLRRLGSWLEVLRSRIPSLLRKRPQLVDPRVRVRLAGLRRKAFYGVLEVHAVLRCETLEAAVQLVRDRGVTLFRIGSARARWRAFPSLSSLLPLGLGTVHVSVADQRRRALESHRSGKHYLCRLTLRRWLAKPVSAPPVGMQEWVHRIQIDWNTKRFAVPPRRQEDGRSVEH